MNSGFVRQGDGSQTRGRFFCLTQKRSQGRILKTGGRFRQGDGSFVLLKNCMLGWDRGRFSVPCSIDCVATAPPCIDHYNRNTGVYQERDPSKTPRGRLPSGCCAIRSFVPSHVGQGAGHCQDERTVPLSSKNRPPVSMCQTL